MTDFNKQQPGRGKVLNPPHENAFSARTEADIFLLNQPTEPKSKVGTTKKFWCVLKLLKKKTHKKQNNWQEERIKFQMFLFKGSQKK